MSEILKSVTDKIPHVWFDWYGRLIPGCIAIVIYMITFGAISEFSSKNILGLLLLAYLIGHVFQPFSSGLLNIWLKNIEKAQTEIVSKAYAELVGFVSILLIVSALLIFNIIKNNCLKLYEFLMTGYILLFILLILSMLSVLLRKKALLRKLGQPEKQQ